MALPRRYKTLLILPGLVVLGLAAIAKAGPRCEDIAGDLVLVGEARYATRTGADSFYSNIYWGGSGDELDLDPYNRVGGANSSSTSLNFGAQAHHDDNTLSDCTNVTFTLQLQRSATNTEYTPCPEGTVTSSSYTYTVNSCIGGSDSHFVHAGRAFGGSGLSYKRYWNATLSVNAVASDSGCFEVANQNDCTLTNF